jgi:DNA-binding transcriptional MocR family regulator
MTNSVIPPKDSPHRKDQMVRAIFDTRLNKNCLRVWIYLINADHIVNNSRKFYVFPKEDRIADDLQISRSSVHRAIQRLEELGYFTKGKTRQFGKQYSHNVYYLSKVLPEITNHVSVAIPSFTNCGSLSSNHDSFLENHVSLSSNHVSSATH